MKNKYLVLFILSLFVFNNTSFAQLVGGSCYLQGHWLEIGVEPNGAYGANPAPGGYHPHGVGTSLAMVYDYGHDGWTIGTPPYMGDYTQPGFPQEGWSFQANGQYNNAWQAGGYPGSGSLTGGLTTYSNSGGRIISNWAGTAVAGGLSIKQETRVDTQASWCVITTKFYNTTGAAIPNVYYGRTCDPDNDETWPGGSFTTTNVIVHQNDIDHRVQVSAVGPTGPISYMAYGAKDCRAKVYVCNGGLTPISQLDQIWNQTGGASGYIYLGSYSSDVGYGIVFNIGTINANDSAFISCAYIYDNNNGIDSAFPEPSVSIGGGAIAHPPLPYPNVVVDTYNSCLNPGITSVPVDLVYADDKSWTWSKWTWSPGTGLSATTGAHVTVTTTGLPPSITYTVTGTNPAVCGARTMLITFITCNHTRANSPCYGDTLFLDRVGDSTSCTYYWYGPGGFTSTMQAPYIYPATYVDSGKFFVIRTLAGVSDTDSVAVSVHYKPIVTATNNSPLCEGAVDTLLLSVSPGMAGMTYSWSGPPSFTSTLQNPTIPGYVDADTGVYQVVVTTTFGCKDTATTDARMTPRPPTPEIIDQQYCQGMPFVPLVLDSIVSGATVLWWPAATGGVSTTVAPVIPTSIPGLYTVWASQIVGSCESLRDTATIRVVTTPPAPVVTGNMQYCQHIGPFVPVTVVTTTTTDSVLWYTVAGGGTPTVTEPVPNLNIVPPGRIYNYWVSLRDSGCEGPRTPVNIVIHPKPAAPAVTPQVYCQYVIPGQIIAVADTTDPTETLKYYGPGVTTATTIAPIPNTSIAPDTVSYWVTGTSTYGCVSDSARDVVIVKLQPTPPVTRDSKYCQNASPVVPLNNLVDSAWNAQYLSWYKNGTLLPAPPAVQTNTAPGTTTWYVSQWVNGCQSDSAAISVHIIYQPVFQIWASSPWVCQYDSLQLAIVPQAPLPQPNYYWTLPEGAHPVNQTNIGDSMLTVQFDSANLNHFIVRLRASDDSGFCYDTASYQVRVVPQPTMTLYTKQDVCIGDTVELSLTTRTADAFNYYWYIDNSTLTTSSAVNIVAANSNSGGPYQISWADSGKHVISVTSSTQEGCKSFPIYDSVDVHGAPDAAFQLVLSPNQPQGSLCIEDSIMFSARTANYSNLYEWSPTAYFNNENKPSVWGKLRDAKDIVTLKVTDPYGCSAAQSLEVDPGTCCKLVFPNAFAPGYQGANSADDNVFKPLYTGYHRFHMFRIVNRWGQTIFESANSSDARWDGKYNGIPQDMGTYYYFVKFDCGGQTIEQKGDVTLIR